MARDMRINHTHPIARAVQGHDCDKQRVYIIENAPMHQRRKEGLDVDDAPGTSPRYWHSMPLGRVSIIVQDEYIVYIAIGCCSWCCCCSAAMRITSGQCVSFQPMLVVLGGTRPDGKVASAKLRRPHHKTNTGPDVLTLTSALAPRQPCTNAATTRPCTDTAMHCHCNAPVRPCPDTAMPRHGRAPTRPCPVTAMHQHGHAPTRPCTDTALPRHGHAPIRPCPDTAMPNTAMHRHGRAAARPCAQAPMHQR